MAKTPADEVFTEDEKAAMRDYAAEKKAAKTRGAAASKQDGEADLVAKIADLRDDDRALAEKLHALIKAHAPELAGKTWYGMPAWSKGDQTLCYLQPAGRFKSRYATFGFSDKARLDEGDLWPVAFALKSLDGAAEAKVIELLKRAAA